MFLFAFTCEPGRGSEPGAGWAFARALAQLQRDGVVRGVLVTRTHRLAKIRSALADANLELEVADVAVPRWLVGITGERRVRWAALWWQWRAVRRLRRRIAATPDAIVHHVTFATEAMPTFERPLARDAALVFGPAGSTATAEGASLRNRLRESVRAAVARGNLRDAVVTIAQSDEVAAGWARHRGADVVEPNFMVSSAVVASARATAGPRIPNRIACVGHLIARKRFDLALQAFAAVRDPEARLVVIGAGPEERRLRALADELGVADRVRLLGAVPRVEAMRALAESKVLLHPSAREGAPGVVGEAQMLGAIPVVVARCGSDTMIDLAGLGVRVERADAVELARAVEHAMTMPDVASDRWSDDRLPGLLTDWYASAAAKRGRPR